MKREYFLQNTCEVALAVHFLNYCYSCSCQRATDSMIYCADAVCPTLCFEVWCTAWQHFTVDALLECAVETVQLYA